MEVTGLKKMKTDVRNESLALLNPKTEQHEIFPCNESIPYKTEWPPKNLGIETELPLQFFNESTVRLLHFLRTRRPDPAS